MTSTGSNGSWRGELANGTSTRLSGSVEVYLGVKRDFNPG